MYTPRENFLRTVNKDNPDRLVCDYTAFGIVRDDPVTDLDRGIRVKGKEIVDIYGTTIIWPENQPGGMPHVTEENKVIKDITRWREELKLPDYDSMDLDWTKNRASVAAVDKENKMLTSIMATGLFERLHFLMGFEDTLVNLLMEPEAMHDLLDALLEVRMTYVRLLIDNMHPEVIIHHDDWGNHDSLFMQADVWREFFKERYRKLYGYMRERGVIVIHHADCHCAAIVKDMAEIGVQIWQGAIPNNDICKVQKELNGDMIIMGGIDAGIDKPDWTEEEVRRETRRACDTYAPNGAFIPCLTYGGPGSIFPGVDTAIRDEIEKYNAEHNKL
ncbi:uroporphyrinogen decarboxylase family protein [Murimonas intestini]|uniref:Uroporphyrinogen decarboxylase n=1 Tax=Murimonas intestini TaxID=1337051 RepID=A0AB73T854_9FIRM|nr:uroporphyrinogen decarboxylase family protein [Murimonas intestini]MCR1841142.1 uroporphyrinogen decarboxylase (URO-D) [Murimonas intestini]MCR1866060.1 uroporphyrinogen decarboxylase (URO-D) [Murimonas intestini]MCR1882823.1 uroporphyrinogen decarboxylase (URO-D) [Murimonas intestini]